MKTLHDIDPYLCHSSKCLESVAFWPKRIPRAGLVVVRAMKAQSGTVSLGCTFLLASLLAGGCGGGTLALRITDAPPDTENMSSVVVTLAKIEAHLAGQGGHDHDGGMKAKDDDGHGGWHTLIPVQRSYDLLKLQNDVTEALGELELPEGKITQIRLFIDPAGPNVITLKSGQACPLDLHAVDHGGVKINHPFKALSIQDGRRVEAVIDFDLKESVERDGHCLYRLKPVIKLKSVKE
jgi:hypothetical protein